MRHGRIKRGLRTALLVGGIGVSILGIGIMASVPYFYYRSHTVGSKLLSIANHRFQNTVAVSSEVSTTPPIPVMPRPDTLVAELDIPTLSLKAPVLEGVADREINVAVGHLPTSVLPGEPGTSILAAHNATWFRHSNRLKPGDKITVATSYGTFDYTVTGNEVVHTGSPIKNTGTPTLILEACYPLNALYLTPYRYLVFAKLTSQLPAPHSLVTLRGVNSYAAQLPTGLPQSDTLLADNNLPLGTLSYTGSPNGIFEQSNKPLDAANAVVSLYLAWQHASAHSDMRYLSNLFGQTGVQSSPLSGVPVDEYRYDSSFDIRLHVEGEKLIDASATTVTTTPSGIYQISVSATVKGTRVFLTNVLVSPYQ
ncbi:class D sortase [Alicyclobacillus sp. ALC3]|uniref:class D sortase n=1 Tax=Alicyclobacillus sp. ALC3 TaxID=2796143 RepID=UPI002379EA46|nr:class D sortase [Alicyclobacillus sp. ALC3]WDL96102.1 class D sortase [Alicyclobacillus sp. ALC3]